MFVLLLTNKLFFMKVKFFLLMLMAFISFSPVQAALVVPAQTQSNSVEVQSEQLLPRQEVKKAKKEKKGKYKAPESQKQTQGKTFLVAFLLFWFLGFLGIHRFYLGFTGLGILYLLTAAIFGIGWIVDLILFIIGKLKPKGGDYEKA